MSGDMRVFLTEQIQSHSKRLFGFPFLVILCRHSSAHLIEPLDKAPMQDLQEEYEKLRMCKAADDYPRGT